MRVLLTGGSGFLGSALCDELVQAGHDVVVFDDHSRGKPERLARFEGRVRLVSGDVRDYDAVREATEGCEVVWHLAYINGTRYFYEKPDVVLEVGIEGTQNTIKAALDAGVRRYVLASTSETYNSPTHVPTTEGSSAVQNCSLRAILFHVLELLPDGKWQSPFSGPAVASCLSCLILIVLIRMCLSPAIHTH